MVFLRSYSKLIPELGFKSMFKSKPSVSTQI